MDFARAAIGKDGLVSCEFEFFPENVGKELETKQEIIEIPSSVLSNDMDALRLLLEPFEVDGWQGHFSDMTNTHRRTNVKSGKNLQSVTFGRYVDKGK